MIYGCSGCKFRSTALEEVKAHHAVAHKDRGKSGGRRGNRAKPAKPLEVVLIDSDDDDDDSDSNSDSGDDSDDSGGASSEAEADPEPDRRRKRKSDEGGSKPVPKSAPSPKRAATAKAIMGDRDSGVREQEPPRKPGRPRKAVVAVKQEARTAEPVDKSAETEEARRRDKIEAAQKRAEAKEAELRMTKAAEDKKRAEEDKKAAAVAEKSKTQHQESEKSSRAAATGEFFRCTLCGGQAGSASEYQIHLFGRHELLW